MVSWRRTEKHDVSVRAENGIYCDTTPAVTYTYYQSGAKPQVGQLKSVSSSVGMTTYIYDKMGDVVISSQMIAGPPIFPRIESTRV